MVRASWLSTKKINGDQVTLLTQESENSFSAKKKAGAVFVDLTAAYDTVWYRDLTCKLLHLLPDRHMFHSSWSLSAIVAYPHHR